MKFFCVVLPLRLNRINSFSRFSLFVLFVAVCLHQQISLNNQCVAVAFPDGYSRVLFNLFPRKNHGINSQPIVSYGYGYNLAHPTGRGSKDLDIAESVVKANVVFPKLLVSPTIPSLRENRHVIFESEKDVQKLIPGVPLLFKLRQPSPSDDNQFSPWSLSSNPRILLAGSVIPSNFNFKYYRNNAATTTEFPSTESQESDKTNTQVDNSVINQDSFQDAYLPVSKATISKTTVAPEPEVIQEEFPLPFPLPRPSLKQVEADDSDISLIEKNSEKHLFHTEDLRVLLPPNFKTTSDETSEEYDRELPRPRISIRNYTTPGDLLKELEIDTGKVINVPVPEVTTESTLSSPYYPDETTNITDITTGNKLTRQIQEDPHIEDFLDVPPLHYEPDSTTEKTTDTPINYREAENTSPQDDPQTNLENRNNQSRDPSNGGRFTIHARPKSDVPHRTTPNSVVVTPILPVEPEQESTPIQNQNYNPSSPPYRSSPNEHNFNRNTVKDNQEASPGSENRYGSSLSTANQTQILNTDAALDPVQRLIQVLTASIQKLSSNSNAPSSGSHQFFTFHIGTININLDNKGSTVPNQYTILSNIAGSPSSPNSNPDVVNPGTQNSQRKPSSVTNLNRPSAFSLSTSPNSQYSSYSPKLADTVITSTGIPFTVTLPKPITPSDPDEDIYEQQDTSYSENQAQQTQRPGLPTVIVPQDEFDSSEQKVAAEVSPKLNDATTTGNILSKDSGSNLEDFSSMEQNQEPKAISPALLNSQEELKDSELDAARNQSNVPQSLPVGGGVLPHLIVPIEERVSNTNIIKSANGNNPRNMKQFSSSEPDTDSILDFRSRKY